MNRIIINEHFSLSSMSHGYWRIDQWDASIEQRYQQIKDLIAMGITTFDHANIYAGGDAERLFGDVLNKYPELRDQIEIVTKCGIVRNLDDQSGLCPSYYNTSYEHIIQSVDESLARLQTSYIDVLLIHRVDHLMDYHEVARAFSDLKRSGKVRYFGVSNFLYPQLEAMYKAYPEIILNQIQVSVDHLEHFKNGTLEKIQALDLKVMAYSPLGGGRIFSDSSYKPELKQILEKIQQELNATSLDQVMLAWLLKHPLHIIPILGTGKTKRIESAINSQNLEMNNQQWYAIYAHSQMERLP